jgi:sn-glycerol 3-phosphate transport system substrate-binding protein
MTNKNRFLCTISLLLASSFSISALAATEVHWWHAMGGVNGERVDKIAADFNATQS